MNWNQLQYVITIAEEKSIKMCIRDRYSNSYLYDSRQTIAVVGGYFHLPLKIS